MRRLLAVLLALSLVAPTAAAIPDARLTVSQLTVAPETPTVGEPVTVTATVRDSVGSPSPVELTSVRLVDGDETLAEATNPGSLSGGDTLTVDLTTTFDEAGAKSLAVVAVGEDSDGETVRVRRPVTVVAERAPPQISFDSVEPVATAENDVAVQLSNPNTDAYRNLTVTLDAPGAATQRRTVPVLAGGETAELNFSFVPSEAGDATVAVDVAYTGETGVQRTTRYAEQLTVEPLDEDVGVSVRPTSQGQPQGTDAGNIEGLLRQQDTLRQQGTDGDTAPDAVTVEVTNFGNAPLRDAVVRPTAGERRLPRRYVGSLAPGDSTTVEVSLDAVRSPANVTATVDYRTGNRTGSSVGAYDYRPPEGAVRLTGVNLTLDGDRLRLDGNAGNVGDGAVTGVVVAVGDSEHVEPAYPQRDYFVGTIEGSEFTPFELTAVVDVANATSVPVVVTYRVDGVERNRTVELPVDRSRLTPADDGSDRGPLAVGVGIGIGAAAVVGGLAAIARRYR